ncbi:MAG: dihydroorotase [Gammaproteobacteria bacterium]|nr:dihydroorotase [Gammaproteobacteria bacterium]
MNKGNLVISGGRVIDPKNQVNAVLPVFIYNGKIAAVGQKPEGFVAEQELNAEGAIVCPGFVDLCTRFREPGDENKATIASEAKAAARSGITTACIPPDTVPLIDSPAMIELIQESGSKTGCVQLVPVGALTRDLAGHELTEMGALKAAGCSLVSNARQPISNLQVLKRALEYAASFHLVVMIQPNDPWLSSNGVMHEGAISTRLGLSGIPEIAETVAVAQIIALTQQIGVHVHFGQLSCQRSVQMISRAQFDGVPITADVSAHQLHLTEHAVDGYNAMGYVLPPLRTIHDRDALQVGVKKRIISAICSDHQPHEEAAKLDVLDSTEPGISSLETLLPLCLGLVSSGVLTMTEMIDRLTAGPAEIIGAKPGCLSIDQGADICVFNPDKEWIVCQENWISQGKNTPYWGKTMTGKVLYTIHNGDVVYSEQSQEL